MTAPAIAAVLLGAALLLAGGAKIAAGPAWPVQAAGLGTPALVVPFVPWLEIVLGAALCAQLARTVVAALAIALLLVFTGLLVLRISQGQRPPCACFGSWSAQPIGWKHLVRNAVLIALGVVALVA